MTECANDVDRRLPSASRSMTTVAVLVAVGLLAGVAGCDTVAQIPFGERSFHDVAPVAITPDDGGQCNGFTGSADLEMVLLDDDNLPIAPGEDLARLTLQDDDVAVDFDGGAVYELPDIPCSDDSECQEYSSAFSCESTPSDDVGNRCQMGSGVGVPQEFEQAEFVADQPETQALGVAISVFGQWRGWYHTEFGDYYIFNEDGPNLNYEDQNDTIATAPVEDVAVDLGFNRQNALNNMAGDWGRLNAHIGEEREMQFGAWTFGEQRTGDLRSVIFAQDGVDERWTTDRAIAEEAFSALDTNPGRSAPLTAMLEILDDYEDPAVQDVEHRQLVFVVDGPDELRSVDTTNDFQTDLQNVVDRANQLDVEISIVHVDPELTDPSFLRDDWAYYDDQEPCDSNDECMNFETCRAPTPYTESADSDDIDDLAHLDDLDTRYCMPEYDENGRVGPVGYYDRLACETGGDYAYVPGNSQTLIEGPLRPLVHKFEGTWATNFVVNDYGDLAPQSDTAGRAHLLEMDLEVDILGNTETHRFEHDGRDDWRRAVVTPEAN